MKSHRNAELEYRARTEGPLTGRLFCGQRPCEELRNTLGVAGFALPNDEHPPPALAEFVDVSSIARFISRELSRPIVGTGFWNSGQATSVVRMPKAAVHEYYQAPLTHYDVGAAR